MLFIIEWPELVDVWIIIMMIMNLIFFCNLLANKRKKDLVIILLFPHE